MRLLLKDVRRCAIKYSLLVGLLVLQGCGMYVDGKRFQTIEDVRAVYGIESTVRVTQKLGGLVLHTLHYYEDEQLAFVSDARSGRLCDVSRAVTLPQNVKCPDSWLIAKKVF